MTSINNAIHSIKSPLLKSFLISESNFWFVAQKSQHLLPPSTTLEQAQSDPRALRPSPFQFRKSKLTGKWQPPRYSRRQQADLIKAARAEGVMHLLPTSVKDAVTDAVSVEKPFNWQEKAMFDVLPRAPRAVAEKKFKGSLWHRKQPARQAAIHENLQNMSQKIDFWNKVRCSLSLFCLLAYSLQRKRNSANRNTLRHYLSRFICFTLYTLLFIAFVFFPFLPSSCSSPYSPFSMARRFTVKVPATSANLACGFDCLGASWEGIDLRLSISHQPYPATKHTTPTITYTGEGAGEVPLDPYKNLTTRVCIYVLRCHDIGEFPDELDIKVHNEIPFGRGLGSSGAAVVAGVLLADALADLRMTPSRQLDFALMVERHPDNVAAALIGGFVGSYLKTLPAGALDPSSVPMSEVLPEYPRDASKDWGSKPPVPPHEIGHWLRYGWAEQIKALVVIPQFELSTAKARGCLPELYERGDVVFNLQRLAVLTTALSINPPDPHLIWEAMQDRLHQPYRAELIPGLPEITRSLTPSTHPGLLGICLSGAGPTILALHTHNDDAIAQGICSIFAKNGVQCRLEVKGISLTGSTVNWELK
ncbi:hypothetical protein E3P96_03669 [Wallemia ichthyophaga]|nr:hypothetical protein E3P96_03669 [Wallemia ichthyophaga]